MGERGAYRLDCSVQLEALDRKRLAAGVTQDELFARAGISRATGQRIFADGRAFRGKLNALTLAMRELEKEKRREGLMFAEAAS